MFRNFLRLCSAAFLCLLLVYAPELFQTVRSSYHISTKERVLLRISLCTQDREAANIFDEVLPIYIKTHPSVHIRILRGEETLHRSSDAPFPDLLLLSPAQLNASLQAIASVFPLPLSDGSTLIVVIPHSAAQPEHARSLLLLIAEQLGAPLSESLADSTAARIFPLYNARHSVTI